MKNLSAASLALSATLLTGAALGEPPEKNGSRMPSTESFFYATAGAGVSYLTLATVNSSALALGNAGGVGEFFDVGIGARLVVFTIGPRLRYHKLGNLDLWQLNGEVALHVPVRKWDGYVGLHAGYSFVGRLTRAAYSDASSSTPSEDLRVRGFDTGLQFGLSYYFSRFFSVGGDLSGEVLFVRRPALATTTDPTFGAAGGGVGLGATAGLHVGGQI